MAPLPMATPAAPPVARHAVNMITAVLTFTAPKRREASPAPALSAVPAAPAAAVLAAGPAELAELPADPPAFPALPADPPAFPALPAEPLAFPELPAEPPVPPALPAAPPPALPALPAAPPVPPALPPAPLPALPALPAPAAIPANPSVFRTAIQVYRAFCAETVMLLNMPRRTNTIIGPVTTCSFTPIWRSLCSMPSFMALRA